MLLKKLDRFSIGTGDRFCHQGNAQLASIVQAGEKDGLDLSIVWNKSYREHDIIHSSPQSVRLEADQAVKNFGWQGNYFVDADHINLSTVDLFLDSSDFFTIDVADFTGEKAKAAISRRLSNATNGSAASWQLPDRRAFTDNRG